MSQHAGWCTLHHFKEIIMIKQFDRAICQQLAADVKTALEAVAKKHGLTVKSAGGRFNPTEFTEKLKWTVGDKAAVAKQAKADWDSSCGILGLKPTHFSKEVECRGQVWRVCGLNPRRRRYPVLAENANGQFLQLSVDYLTR